MLTISGIVAVVITLLTITLTNVDPQQRKVNRYLLEKEGRTSLLVSFAIPHQVVGLFWLSAGKGC